MSADATASNVKQAVPFFNVTDITKSLAFYIDGLGFTLKHQWTPEGRIRWCWLEIGDASLMLQEYSRDGHFGGGAPAGPLGQGVSVCFMCTNALAIYHAARERGLAVDKPFVGNGLWDLALQDPDGYHVHFESPADVPEDTVYDG